MYRLKTTNLCDLPHDYLIQYQLLQNWLQNKYNRNARLYWLYDTSFMNFNHFHDKIHSLSPWLFIILYLKNICSHNLLINTGTLSMASCVETALQSCITCAGYMLHRNPRITDSLASNDSGPHTSSKPNHVT